MREVNDGSTDVRASLLHETFKDNGNIPLNSLEMYLGGLCSTKGESD